MPCYPRKILIFCNCYNNFDMHHSIVEEPRLHNTGIHSNYWCSLEPVCNKGNYHVWWNIFVSPCSSSEYHVPVTLISWFGAALIAGRAAPRAALILVYYHHSSTSRDSTLSTTQSFKVKPIMKVKFYTWNKVWRN